MTKHLSKRLCFYVEDAGRNLRLLWRQNLLSLLGIAAGSACFIAMLNIGGSVRQEINQLFTEMGPGRFTLSLTGNRPALLRPPSINQVLTTAIQGSNAIIAPMSMLNSAFFHQGAMTPAPLIATTPEAAGALGLAVAHGRFLRQTDASQQSVVLGAAAAQAFSHASPATLPGQYIRVDQHYFKIIGVLNHVPDSLLLPFSINESLFMPIDGLSRLSGRPSWQALVGNVPPSRHPQATANALRRAVMALPGVQDAQIKLPAQLVDGMQKSQRQFSYFLFSVGAISLLLGSIGIMNIMLSNVRSRAQEIGLRLAVGAQVQDIRYLFLLESALLTTVGATAGLMLSTVLTGAYAMLTETPFRLSAGYSLFGLICTLLVSMLFGLYPAIKASRLQPADALRDA